ncbi:MAG: hypothetical protein ABEN55_20410 [Bradymonadaceae bacterium]
MAEFNDEQGYSLTAWEEPKCQISEDGKIVVLDGQHRIRAAQKSGHPVQFKVDVDRELTPELIAGMQQEVKDWSSREWLGMYVHFGVEDYIFAQNICENYDISVPTFRLLSGYKGGRQDREFKSGDMKVTNRAEIRAFLNDLEELRSRLDYGDLARLHKSFWDIWGHQRWSRDNMSRLLKRIDDYGAPQKRVTKPLQIAEIIETHNYKTNQENRIDVSNFVDTSDIMGTR